MFSFGSTLIDIECQEVANLVDQVLRTEPEQLQLRSRKLSEFLEEDDDSELKKAISVQYGNVCDLAKRWIYDDQKNKKKNQQQYSTAAHHDVLDIKLLSLLDENIKYDIMEYIPTYSRWSSLERNDQFMDEIGVPYRTNRNDHNSVQDHDGKSKAFNRRMMTSILQVREIILNISDKDSTIWAMNYFLSFLRKQRLFKESHGKLPLSEDSIYLYSEDVEQLKILKSSSSSTTTATNESDGATPFGKPIFGKSAATSDDQNLEPETPIDSSSSPVDIFSESHTSLLSLKGIRQKRTTKTSSPFTFMSPTEHYGNVHPVAHVSWTAPYLDEYQYLPIEEFIGNNTTIERLVLLQEMSEFLLHVVLKQCKRLKKLDLLCPCKLPDSFSNQTLEEITTMKSSYITNEQCINLSSLKKIIKFRTGHEVFNFSTAPLSDIDQIIEERNPWQIIEYLTEFHPSMRMILIEYLFSYNPSISAFGAYNDRLVCGLFQTQLSNIGHAKEVLDYMIKTCNFPCENVMSTTIEPHTDTCQCLLQYLVYLCNEYQHGRFFNISNSMNMSNIKTMMLAMDYGWHFWKQQLELPFFVCDNKKPRVLLSKVLEIVHSQFDEQMLLSLLVAYLRGSKFSELESLISFFLIHNMDLLTKTVIRKVKCSTSFGKEDIWTFP
ncbi:hypothetical protein C9374_011935 [Naegleria lovaniensis]|uniref:Uncharacterized protein n=1 Tax=Naegleria lovaniensis TaxID=51637 RepID=A0AA88GBY4_NAELO|nr:uncharacterized protein C9374_011935 [Naegleria lovaniensis]KAG2373646.1 hypothetical protein C9374_011935 [Naegleria lovaniensis]